MNENALLWVPVNERLKAIETLDAGKPRKKCVVLGAGLAGLVAAYELNRLGHHVEVFEATGRVGGRVLTHRFPSGQYGELGAMRIPGSHDYTRYYVTLCGLRLRPFIDSNPLGFFDIRGIVTQRRDSDKNLLPAFRLTKHELALVRHQGIGHLLSSIVAAETAKLSQQEQVDLFNSKIDTDQLKSQDATSLRSALTKQWSTEAMSLLGTATSIETLWSRPLTKYIRDALMQNSLGLEEIEGGMDLLPHKLSILTKTNISFHTEISAIERLGQGTVRLTLQAAGKQRQLDCDTVLCTLPFGVLRRLKLRNISAGKMRSVRNMSYVSATKVLLHARTRFWETQYGIFGGRSVSDSLSRQTYYPSDNVAPPSVSTVRSVMTRRDPYSWGIHSGAETAAAWEADGREDRKGHSQEVSKGPGVLLGSYAWGTDARRSGAVSQELHVRNVIDCVSRYHPEIAGEIDEYVTIDWDRHPWSAGAYADLLPTDLSDYYPDAERPEGALHFAGEHISPFPGWIQGSIYSTLKAVFDMLSEQ